VFRRLIRRKARTPPPKRCAVLEGWPSERVEAVVIDEEVGLELLA
jgi:hypothetical protein